MIWFEKKKISQFLLADLRCSKMFYRITMSRSAIGLPQKTKDTLLALGLKKRGAISYRSVSAANAGMIAKVKELVKLELVDEFKTKSQVRLERKGNPGFKVVGSMLQ